MTERKRFYYQKGVAFPWPVKTSDSGDIIATEGPFSGRIIGGERLDKSQSEAIESYVRTFRLAQEERDRIKPGSTDFTPAQKKIINDITTLEEKGGLGKPTPEK